MPIAAWLTSTRGTGVAASSPSTRFFVARTRLSRIRCFASSVEPLVDLLADQVDHPVHTLEAPRRSLVGRVRSVPRDGRVGVTGLLWVAAEARDLLAPRQQCVVDGGSDQSSCTGDEYSHRNVLYPRRKRSVDGREGAGFLDTRAIPSRRASSTTALATAGATSRSKTDGMM